MGANHAINQVEREPVEGDEEIGSGADASVAVEYLADAPERSLQDAADAAAARNEPLKLRTALQLWNAGAKPYGQFRGWRGQAWTIALKGVDEARRAQQVIELLFDLIALGGVEKVAEILIKAKRKLEVDR